MSADDPLIVAGDGRKPGTIIIREARDVVVEPNYFTEISVRLPLGVTWDANAILSNIYPATLGMIFSRREEGGRNLTFVVTSTAPIPELRLSGQLITVASDFSGAVNAEINVFSRGTADGRLNWRETMSVRIAEVPAGGTRTIVRDATRILSGVSRQLAGTIEISENAVGALRTNHWIRLTLPDGVAFSWLPTTTAAAIRRTPGAEDRRIEIQVPAPQRVGGLYRRTIITLSDIRLDVRREVGDGPINVVIDNLPVNENDSRVTRAEVTVATVGASLVNVSRYGDLPAAWNLGRVDQPIGTIRLAETVFGALSPNRIVTFTLPIGYTWHSLPANENFTFSRVSDGGRTLTYWTLVNATTSRTDFNFTDGRINARIDATPGDVVVTVGGNAGANGTATVATTRRPVTVTVVSTPNVRANELNQLVGDIVIRENYVGALTRGQLFINVQNLGLTASSVSVTDVAGSEPAVRVVSPGVISITPAIAPLNPATITIHGIRGNFDLRTLINEGQVTADVWGDAVLENQEFLHEYDNGRWIARPVNDTGWSGITFAEAVGTEIANDIVVANLVSRAARTTVFTVNQTGFTVDGVAQTPLVVAPFILDGRTLVPLRAAANAVGVADRDIVFDVATRTITLSRGDRFVQFTLGSRVVSINGMPWRTMLTSPVIRSDRSMLPAGYVAAAFGGTAQWDATTRTVTITGR